MAGAENREDITEEERREIEAASEQPSEASLPAEPPRPLVREFVEDELTACEETLTEHIATGVPTDATVTGPRGSHHGAHGHCEESLEETDVVGPDTEGKKTPGSL